MVLYALNEWLQDLKKNQLPSILGGVGPMYSLVQLGRVEDLSPNHITFKGNGVFWSNRFGCLCFFCCSHKLFKMDIFLFSVQGIRDLFWLPVEQYRKDGRIVRGLQRGAHSFTTSTAMAALELTNRLVQTVQVEFICNVLFRAHEAETYRSHGRRFRV